MANILINYNATAFATQQQLMDLYTSRTEDLAVMWTLTCAFFVVLMQPGFALLESGTIRNKNVKNVLLKNIIDAAISIACWYAVGYAFAYGDCDQNAFIGHSNFFGSSCTGGYYWARWVFRWAFSATAATIVSGAVAERLQFKAYATYTAIMTAFIYPVVVHWVWSSSGWLSAMHQTCAEMSSSLQQYSPIFSNTMGLIDFSGSGVVHMVGGGGALMGAILLGPRLGRFLPEPDRGVAHWEPTSPTNMAIGVIILWIGWYGFNAGSNRCFEGCMGVAAKVAVNTTLSIGSSCLTCLLLAALLGDATDISPPLNGILAGGVSITAGCAVVQEYGAVIIGIGGAIVYTCSSRMLQKLRIDDPLDASPVHFFCGMWGLLTPGFFATQTAVQAAYSYANDWGVFYGGSGRQLGMQLLGVVVIAAWTCSLSGLVFYCLKLAGALRVPRAVEIAGLDFAQGLQRSRLRRYAEELRWAADAPPRQVRDAEAAQHGGRSADLVLHGRCDPATAAFHINGWSGKPRPRLDGIEEEEDGSGSVSGGSAAPGGAGGSGHGGLPPGEPLISRV